MAINREVRLSSGDGLSSGGGGRKGIDKASPIKPSAVWYYASIAISLECGYLVLLRR